MKIYRERLWIRLPGTVIITAILMVYGSCKSKSDSVPVPLPSPDSTGKATVWLTKGDKSKLFSNEGKLEITGTATAGLPLVTIDTSQRFQTIEGFGAALTGSSAYLLNRNLDAASRSAILKNLFDPVSGIGISSLRLTIGASDFSPSYYTYDDLATGETDFTLQNFTLEKDLTDVIPVLKEITGYAPEIRLIGSPWSAPAWMKTSGSLVGGKLRTNCYDTYAGYFIRYIQEMKNQGINISAITPQNEPLYSTATYPCMEMQDTDQVVFIRDHLGPKFQSAGIITKIIIYDHNWDHPEYPISVLSDASARSYISGSAFHGYSGDVSSMSTVHYADPDKDLYFTEISGGTWATNFSDNLMWNMKNIFIGTMQNWSKCALLWNLVLDQNGAPHENGQSTCRGVLTLNTSGGQITFNEEYYSIAHFSKFVRPGAVRIALQLTQGQAAGIEAVAFQNSDGSKVMVVCNYSNTAQGFSVKQGNNNFAFSFPAVSVVTIVW